MGRSRSIRIRLVSAFLLVGLVQLGAGCGGSGTAALDDLIRAIAKSQGVEKNTVRKALQRVATTEEQQFQIAKQWEATLPPQRLPDLRSRLDEIAEFARLQLKSEVCGALMRMPSEGVPTGEEFVYGYLSSAAISSLTESDLASLIQAFDELWADAYAGTLTVTDVRLKLLEIQYC